MIREACPDDVFARARTGSISAAENVRLERHLAGCEACRTLLFLGRGFDQRMAAQPGDTRVLARFVERAREARAADRESARDRSAPVSHIEELARRPRRRRAVVLLIAAALTVGAGAAAAPGVRAAAVRIVARLASAVRETPAPVATALPSKPIATPPPVTAPAIVSAEPSAEPVPVAEAPRARARGHAGTAKLRAKAEQPVPTAERLFAEANARRKAGDVARARSLYAELERRYPSSPEAQVASASLGRLLLERAGDPQGALDQYDRLLARPPGSMAQPALAEEALFGRATALRRMGRAAEEKQTWLELLARFPGSVYAERARARLRALK